ncbi:MAG: HupE/UreJ family protein [Pseudomonadales bacterium]
MKFSLRFIATISLGLLLAPLTVNNAQAHLFAPSLLKMIETTQHNYNVVWKTPNKTASNTPLQPTWPDSCEVTSESPSVHEGTGTISGWTLRCDQLGNKGLVGQTLGVSGLAQNQASAMVMLNLRDGRQYQSVLNTDAPDFLVPQAPRQTAVMTEYPLLGIEHIWGGIDHLMFVFGLLLLVGGGSRLLWTITAFTVGHSITLAVVTLGLLTYPVALIEFAIALSIFVLALELTRNNSLNTQGLFGRYPWLVAGGFGLLHGMGFAGALAEIGLPQNNVPIALLFFNIGIEIGQIIFVLLALSICWLIKRTLQLKQNTINQERLLPIPVYMLGGLSAMWCIERGMALIS